MIPVQIKVSANDYKQILDAVNSPQEPNDALKRAAAKYQNMHSRHISLEEMRRIIGDPMQGVSLVGRMPTAEEQKATSDYLTRELGDQFRGVSLIVPESELEKRMH